MSSLLEGLFANKAIKNAAFGAIKKQLSSNGIELVTLWLDNHGDIQVTPYKDPVRVVPADAFGDIKPGEPFVVLTEADFEDLVALAKLGQDAKNNQAKEEVTHE